MGHISATSAAEIRWLSTPKPVWKACSRRMASRRWGEVARWRWPIFMKPVAKPVSSSSRS